MVDRGEAFTARAMFKNLTGKAYKQFVVARPWREGVPASSAPASWSRSTSTSGPPSGNCPAQSERPQTIA